MPSCLKISLIKNTPVQICFFILLAITLGIGCKSKSSLDIDVSKVPLELNILRFERDLYKIDTNAIDEKPYQDMERKYPEFYPIFIQKVASLGNYPNDYKKDLKSFLSNKDLKKLKLDVEHQYPDLNSFQSELTNGFKHFKYYYPQYTLPQFLTFLSGFNSAIVNTDSTLGIGLDMFLGSKYPIYRSVQFPEYISRTLKPEYIPLIAMKGFAKQVFQEKKGNPRVIDEMIYEGKILYFLDAMYPQSNDSIKISYTGRQILWCKEHESEIWASLLENNKIFKGEKNDLDTYFAEGPFTNGLDPNSAPRLGEWTGWQIIRKYMESEPKISLQELMKENDSEKILRISGYRP